MITSGYLLFSIKSQTYAKTYSQYYSTIVLTTSKHHISWSIWVDFYPYINLLTINSSLARTKLWNRYQVAVLLIMFQQKVNMHIQYQYQDILEYCYKKYNFRKMLSHHIIFSQCRCCNILMTISTIPLFVDNILIYASHPLNATIFFSFWRDSMFTQRAHNWVVEIKS